MELTSARRRRLGLSGVVGLVVLMAAPATAVDVGIEPTFGLPRPADPVVATGASLGGLVGVRAG